jgi:hypothetical protein
MRRQLRWYGASPLHLLALLACFGLAGYAAARLIPSRPVAVLAWFLGAVIGHDLLLVPLYSLADRSVMAAIRHRDPQLPVTPWINYVRVPAALSGLLLLVWFPLILRLRSPYHASTGLSADPYAWHWLAVTGALFLLSAVAFALRLRGGPRTASPPERPAPAAPGAGPGAGGRHETDPGHPGQANPAGGQPPAIREEREPGQDAGGHTPAERDSRQEPPGSSPGQPRPAAEERDAPGRVLPQAAGPHHEMRPADPAPDAGSANRTRDSSEY